MANDGLIFSFLSKLLPILKTPFIASIVTGLLTAVLACFLNLDELVEMLNIGTLMAYTLVCVCVLILRLGH
jgi:solute carrier family 7 (cationic amino acid transporter), member 3